MVAINQHKRLLKTIWQKKFNTINLYSDGSWVVDKTTPNKKLISTLKVTDLEDDSKAEAYFRILGLYHALSLEIDDAYRQEFEKEMEMERLDWEDYEERQLEEALSTGEEYTVRLFVPEENIYASKKVKCILLSLS